MMNIPEGPAYIIKVIPTFWHSSDRSFQMVQVVEYAEALDTDNASTILEELVHLAAHLDLATNPFHNELAGTALGQYFFEKRVDAFEPPNASQSLLVIDLVRRYVHIHRDAVWHQPALLRALRRLGFEVVRTRGRWQQPAYQNLWRDGMLSGSFPRNPLARIDHDQEPVPALWTNPRFCCEVRIPYPTWPPQPASPEVLARIADWSPQMDVFERYRSALARLNPGSDTHSLGRYLATHDTEELADWFERFAPLCYEDPSDPAHVLSTVLELDTESADGEALAGALVRLAAKMRRLGYSIPEAG